MKTVKIAIACHLPFGVKEDGTFLPVQVGAKLAPHDLGMQKDSDGENLSERNPYYSELTATYWLWKNMKGADYLGLSHYRRFLSFSKLSVARRCLHSLIFVAARGAGLFLTDARYTIPNTFPERIKEKELATYMTSFSEELKRRVDAPDAPVGFFAKKVISSARSNRKSLSLSVGMLHLKKMEAIVAEHAEEYLPYLKESLRSNAYHPFNMVILRADIFDAYCTFLFSMLEKYCDWFLSTTVPGQLSPAVSRYAGYLGELLTDVFCRKLIREGYPIETLYVQTLDFEGQGSSSRQVSFMQRVQQVVNGDY